MNPLLVIICTYNPRREFLLETLAALRAQSIPATEWSLLVVDNGSTDALKGWLDLSWHPSAKIVREEMLGIAHARHRALHEARATGAGTILFVDDDNILNPDYLDRGAQIGVAWPQLGAWGGQLLPRFAVTPPDWVKNYFNYLAITPLSADVWCNCVKSYDMVPPTAGCFLRESVWRRYLELVAQDPRRLLLSRAEDMDLVLTSIDLGLGLGRFRDLQLTHIVPSVRLTPAYVTNLVESTAVGMGMMEYIRYGRIPRRVAPGTIDRALLHWRATRLPEPLRSIHRAELRGKAAARRIVLTWAANAVQQDENTLQPAPVRA
jgi:hypothetical protein